jgi:hypothetical protein
VIGLARSWKCEGALLLVVIVKLLGEQLVEVWLAGPLCLPLANGANGLLLHVTH